MNKIMLLCMVFVSLITRTSFVRLWPIIIKILCVLISVWFLSFWRKKQIHEYFNMKQNWKCVKNLLWSSNNDVSLQSCLMSSSVTSCDGPTLTTALAPGLSIFMASRWNENKKKDKHILVKQGHNFCSNSERIVFFFFLSVRRIVVLWGGGGGEFSKFHS